MAYNKGLIMFGWWLMTWEDTNCASPKDVYSIGRLKKKNAIYSEIYEK